MTQQLFTVLSNRPIAKNTYHMVLRGDTSAITAPGQFINIRLDGFYLRRPISICDCHKDTVTIVYKAVGGGTEAMTRLAAGETLDVLTGLGNGFDTGKSGERPLLIGGGVGTPPLYYLAKKLIGEGKTVTVLLGFNSKDEAMLEDEFRSLGAAVQVMTVDGSYSEQGLVTDRMPADYTYIYTCGPLPMLRAVDRVAVTGGQFSFEERMGCGFGACMGCSCQTKNGAKRLCKEGPVLEREEIVW